MARKRMKKYRKSAKSKKNFEKAVSVMIQKIEYDEMDEHAHDRDFSNQNNENTYESHNEMTELKDRIMQWSIEHCITKRALNDLLSILIFFGFSFLPKDSRTLMKTPKYVPIRTISKGQLWYHGVKVHLEQIFHRISLKEGFMNNIHLDFNFDGVELFNGSNKCFWPMIASIRGIPLRIYSSIEILM